MLGEDLLLRELGLRARVARVTSGGRACLDEARVARRAVVVPASGDVQSLSSAMIRRMLV